MVHLVLITTVLSFSDLILYEAVLTYVGVGVDPSTSSFGGMINLARSEMSRDPVVWWSFVAAFGFMVVLVLAANLFADGVQQAFDPRARALRPRARPEEEAGMNRLDISKTWTSRCSSMPTPASSRPSTGCACPSRAARPSRWSANPAAARA